LFRYLPAPDDDCSQAATTLCVQPAGDRSTLVVQTTPSSELGPEDAAAIYDLHVAYRNSLEVSMDKDVSRDQANFSDLVNIAELSVRRVIAMAKQVKLNINFLLSVHSIV